MNHLLLASSRLFTPNADMRVSSFFAGIGGFDLGLERAGMNVVFQCEIDPFCQQILKRHWPHVPLHDDITTLNPATIPSSDLWCAGWPCQDLSTANTERTGLSGKRSGLFFTFMDLVREIRPAWLVMENAPGLLSAEQGAALESVINTLEANGYLGGWVSCNAVDSGLPHNRDRVFFVASFRSERAYHFFTDSGDNSARESSKAQTRSDFCQVALRDNPLVVQRRGGFGYTLAKSTSIVSDWPYLFIQLTNIGQFSTSNYVDIGGLPRSISGCEFEEIDGKKFLAIDDVFGGQINIVYRGEETFLAMEKDKRVLSIS